MGSALDRAEAKYGLGREPESALTRAERKYGGAPAPQSTGISEERMERDRRTPAVEGVPPPASEAAELIRGTVPGRAEAVMYGAVSGATGGQPERTMNPFAFDPRPTMDISASEADDDPAVQARIAALKGHVDHVREARPGEYLGGELASAAAQPAVGGPSRLAGAVRGGIEGAVATTGAGGSPLVGGAIGAGAGFLGAQLGQTAGKLAAKGQQKAATATAVVAAKQAAKEADEAARAARLAADATAGSKVGKEMRKRAAFADKNARDAGKALKTAEVEARKAAAGGNPGWKQQLGKVAVGGGTVAGGLYVAKDALEDPERAIKRAAEAGAVGVAALAAAKGKRVGTKALEAVAAKGAEAMETTAGRVTRALAGQAATSGRRVGAGQLAKIVLGTRSGQDTAALEAEAIQQGATPEEIASAKRAGARR